MSWRIRPDNDESITPGMLCPNYGADSESFTIRMHHSGKFFKSLGEQCYLGSVVDYIDFCHPDEMSMIELNEMTSELGFKEPVLLHCSRGGIDEYFDLLSIKTDIDALNLVKFIDENRMVGIFVEHVESGDGVEESISVHIDEDVLPSIDEPLEFMGDNEDIRQQKNDQRDDHIESSEPFKKCNFIDNSISDDSDDVQSWGSDSEFSDQIVDSEFDISDDDVLFDVNIDDDVEWGGLKDQLIIHEDSTRDKGKDVANGRSKDDEFYVGMCFGDINEFRKMVRFHTISLGRDVKFPINHSKKVQAKCKQPSCPWLIYASQAQHEDTIQVKTYNDQHKCPRVQKVKAASAALLGELYKNKIYTDPRWPVESMHAWVSSDLKIDIPKHHLYRAKNKVLKEGVFHDVEQYSLLWSYAEEVRETNPGTTMKIKCKQQGEIHRFKRIYICWGSLKKGFLEGCRPIIFFDGCHLKSATGGIILSAVGIDGNNEVYPFVYAVVEKEKKKTWLWFLGLLLEDLGIQNFHQWTIMCDKQKGLIDAVEQLMPGCEHRFCVQHLYQNFKQLHKGLALKNILWKAARASRAVDFEDSMRQLKTIDNAAFDWLVQRPPSHWSRAYFCTHSKCDKLENNMSESFNAMILKARKKPIVDLLESVRLLLMKRIHTRRDQIQNYYGEICPMIEKMLEELKKRSSGLTAHWNGHNQFEIENPYGSKFKVHLGDKTCSCRRWQLSGVPCPHAISGMYFMGYNPEDFVNNFYKKETFIKTYSNLMGASGSHEEWPKTVSPNLIPPKIERMPGRPKQHKRKPQPGEAKKAPVVPKMDGTKKLGKSRRIMTCSLCRKTDHNARKCPLKPNPPAEQSDSDHVGLDIPAPVNSPTQDARGTKRKRQNKKAKNTRKPHEENIHQHEENIDMFNIPVELWNVTTTQEATQIVNARGTTSSAMRTQDEKGEPSCSAARSILTPSRTIPTKATKNLTNEVNQKSTQEFTAVARTKLQVSKATAKAPVKSSVLSKSALDREPTKALTRPWKPPGSSSMPSGVRFARKSREEGKK